MSQHFLLVTESSSSIGSAGGLFKKSHSRTASSKKLHVYSYVNLVIRVSAGHLLFTSPVVVLIQLAVISCRSL